MAVNRDLAMENVRVHTAAATATTAIPKTIGGPAARVDERTSELASREADTAADAFAAPIRSLSILIPVMNEEGNLPELYERLRDQLD
ncbi:MAG: hypothetical protein WBA46_00875, partial [Thermomicrobiales bacterium]